MDLSLTLDGCQSPLADDCSRESRPPTIFFLEGYRGYFFDSVIRLLGQLPETKHEQATALCNAKTYKDDFVPPGDHPYSIVIPFNAPNTNDLEFFSFICKRISSDVNSGRCRLFFDNTNELCHLPIARNLINRLLEKSIVNTGAIYLLCQDRHLNKQIPIRVLNHDYFIIRSWDAIRQLDLSGYLPRFDSDNYANYSHTFLCLNATPRPLRVCTLVELMASGLWGPNATRPNFLLSFPGFRYNKDSGLDLSNLRKMLDNAQYCDIGYYLDWIADNAPFVVDNTSLVGNDLADVICLDAYHATISSLVNETECRPGVQRITEKSYKAFALGHLPIIIGNPGSIKLAGEMGFNTFDRFIDQSYDSEVSLIVRIKKAIQSAVKLQSDIDNDPAVIHSICRIARENIQWAQASFGVKYARDYTFKVLDAMHHID